MFTDAEKVQIRKFCGYPVRGATATQYFGYRYLQQYGELEYIMNNMSLDEETQVRAEYLPKLIDLENAILLASDNLDTAQAAVWIWNKKEVDNRVSLFNFWRQRLINFMGVPPGDYFYESLGATNVSMNVVV